ncbi:MAG: CBS domain-containing protein, partial [Myxococcales bacterium]|nr:CBS domain-containing protein [Myxococcales bacterium]
IHARPEMTVVAVSDLMRRFGVSQLPIMDDSGKALGIVSEKTLLAYLLRQDSDPQSPIAPLASNKYAVVDPTTRLSVLGDLFAGGNVVLVIDKEKLVGILTRIDFIDYVSHLMR